MAEQDDRYRDELLRIAGIVAEKSAGRIRLAHNEENETTETNVEAAHFLKLDGRRLGRDIELYGMMGELVQGWQVTLVDFLVEVLIPIKKTVPNSFSAASTELLSLGLKIYPENLHEQWRNCF